MATHKSLNRSYNTNNNGNNDDDNDDDDDDNFYIEGSTKYLLIIYTWPSEKKNHKNRSKNYDS